MRTTLAALVVLIVFIVFVHPATLLLPAPYSKHAPVPQLLLAAVVAIAVALSAPVLFSLPAFAAPPMAHGRSGRLALICTRLC